MEPSAFIVRWDDTYRSKVGISWRVCLHALDGVYVPAVVVGRLFRQSVSCAHQGCLLSVVTVAED